MNKDFLKEKIGFLKLWLTFFVAIIIGSTAWLANNWDKTSDFFIITTIFFLIILGIAISLIKCKAYSSIKKLKA